MFVTDLSSIYLFYRPSPYEHSGDLLWHANQVVNLQLWGTPYTSWMLSSPFVQVDICAVRSTTYTPRVVHLILTGWYHQGGQPGIQQGGTPTSPSGTSYTSQLSTSYNHFWLISSFSVGTSQLYRLISASAGPSPIYLYPPTHCGTPYILPSLLQPLMAHHTPAARW